MTSGDTEAAREARRVFNNKKRREQRRLALQAQAEHLRDVRHNPRRFWTDYKQGPSQPSFHDMDALSIDSPHTVWRSAEACLKLPPLLRHWYSKSLGKQVGPRKPTCRRPSRLRRWREQSADCIMVGPDGLRAEFFKGLNVKHGYYFAEKQRWLVKHVYDTQPGSVLSDLCEVLNAAFDFGVPGVGVRPFFRLFSKEGTLRSWTTIVALWWEHSVRHGHGQVLSLVMHARLSSWSEAHGARVVGQAGLRDGFRTSICA